ncbi:MAG: hypothetical protein IJC09_07195 [Clostridia bacterium]|nr:hypothetical protein [Clostridia bacterium]
MKFIGEGKNTNWGTFTHGKEYEAFLLEYWQGECKSLHARGDDGQITAFNSFDDFEVVSDENNVLNSYEAIVECVTHNCNEIKYGKRYKSIGCDKNGMYLVMDESFDCYFYPAEYFKILEDKNAILARCSLYCGCF